MDEEDDFVEDRRVQKLIQNARRHKAPRNGLRHDKRREKRQEELNNPLSVFKNFTSIQEALLVRPEPPKALVEFRYFDTNHTSPHEQKNLEAFVLIKPDANKHRVLATARVDHTQHIYWCQPRLIIDPSLGLAAEDPEETRRIPTFPSEETLYALCDCQSIGFDQQKKRLSVFPPFTNPQEVRVDECVLKPHNPGSIALLFVSNS